MMVPTPVLVAAAEEAPPAGLVIEVEREVFLGLLRQTQKPLVFVQEAGFPKTHRHYVRMGGYFFLYRTRQAENLSALATVLPVKAFHASPSSVA